MSARRILRPAIIALVLLGISAAGIAQWVEFGTPVCQFGSDQWYQELAPDGQGGMIVVYESGVPTDIYAQRLDAFGNPLWAAGGVPVCNWANYQGRPCIVADGQGGAVIAWFDWRNGNTDIFAQRLDKDGNRLWTTGGVALCTQTAAQWNPRCATDGAGGAIVAWKDERGADADIYAQRIDQGGTVRWTADGVQLTNAPLWQDNVQVVADGYGGAIFVWQGGDVSIQRVDAYGTVQWGATGKVIDVLADVPNNPVISEETPYGFFLAWEARGGAVDDGIYAQRIDLYGNTRWAGGGLLVNDQANDQELPALAYDGRGGVIITWLDRRAGSGTTDVYAQRLNTAGALEWTSTGEPVCVDAAITQYYPQIVSDGVGGALIAWSDERISYEDIFIQHLDTAGTAQWIPTGLPVAVDHLQQHWVRMLPDGLGGTLMSWMDTRSGNRDIYAQRIDRFGYWGYPAPQAVSAADVPGDQGGRITLAWQASRLDPWPYQQIDRYTLWKSLTAAAALDMLAGGAVLASGPQAIPDYPDDPDDPDGPDESAQVILAPLDPPGTQDKSAATYYWELVGTQDAYHLPAYAATLDTDCDSTALGDCEHFFQVIAHAADPMEYWIGGPVGGRSVDNLAPEILAHLIGTGAYGPSAMTVAWDPSPATDLSFYAVHRGLSADFVPTVGNLIASVTDTCTVDALWDPDNIFHYKVAAVDIHGNTGPWALLSPDGVSDAGDGAPRAVAVLRQNAPNPFNPRTQIAFELPGSGRVSLEVFDVAGRAVRTLVDGQLLPAGTHSVFWDGRDGSGRQVAAGAYFYRLLSDRESVTRRMVLVR